MNNYITKRCSKLFSTTEVSVDEYKCSGLDDVREIAESLAAVFDKVNASRINADNITRLGLIGDKGAGKSTFAKFLLESADLKTLHHSEEHRELLAFSQSFGYVCHIDFGVPIIGYVSDYATFIRNGSSHIPQYPTKPPEQELHIVEHPDVRTINRFRYDMAAAFVMQEDTNTRIIRTYATPEVFETDGYTAFKNNVGRLAVS